MAKKLTGTVRMSRNYGPQTVEFSLTWSEEVKNGADILTLNNSCIEALHLQIHDFEAQHLPRLPIPQSKGLPEASKPKGAQWYVASEMYMVASEKGRFYYIRPGNAPQWKKFGAAVYFDRFKGLTEPEAKELLGDELKHKFPDGMRVLIEEYKGKPRAIQLAHKDNIGEG